MSWVSDALLKFQFQYGAIKRIYPVVLPQGVDKFQFQYGAIKRKANLLELGAVK